MTMNIFHTQTNTKEFEREINKIKWMTSPQKYFPFLIKFLQETDFPDQNLENNHAKLIVQIKETESTKILH